MYTIEHIELLLLLIVSVSFQMVAVLQAVEVQHQISMPEVMKLKLFYTYCWLVAELSQEHSTRII